MEKIIFMESSRIAYSPEKIFEYWGGTMTVGELIEYLSKFDSNAHIMLHNNDYTYGKIDCDSFN